MCRVYSLPAQQGPGRAAVHPCIEAWSGVGAGRNSKQIAKSTAHPCTEVEHERVLLPPRCPDRQCNPDTPRQYSAHIPKTWKYCESMLAGSTEPQEGQKKRSPPLSGVPHCQHVRSYSLGCCCCAAAAGSALCRAALLMLMPRARCGEQAAAAARAGAAAAGLAPLAAGAAAMPSGRSQAALLLLVVACSAARALLAAVLATPTRPARVRRCMSEDPWSGPLPVGSDVRESWWRQRVEWGEGEMLRSSCLLRRACWASIGAPWRFCCHDRVCGGLRTASDRLRPASLHLPVSRGSLPNKTPTEWRKSAPAHLKHNNHRS